MPTDKYQEKEKFRLADLVFFFQFVRPIWKIGLASLILIMVTTLFSAFIPMIGKILIDFVISKTGYGSVEGALHMLGLDSYAPLIIERISSINFIIAALIVAGIIYLILSMLQSYLSSLYQQELVFNLQTRLFNRVLRFPIAFIKSKQTGYLMSRISDDVEMMQFLFSDALTRMISSTLYLIYGVVILLSINMYFAIIIALLIPAYLIIRMVFVGRIQSLSYQEREYNSEVSRDMQEALSGMELVKSFATEKKEAEKVSHKLRDTIRIRISRTLLVSFVSMIIPAALFALMLVILYAGTADIQNGTMTIGDFITILTYLMFLSNAVNDFYRTYLALQPAFASMGRLKEMFSIAPEFEWEDTGAPLKKLDRVSGGIRFDDVSFAYTANEPVLKNMSFEIKPGEAMALLGHSGAGKTTIVSLILKLYVPQSGAIYLDGVNLKELDHAWLRRQIGIVSQDIFLFNDTIENNIKYGKPDASHEDVVNAAKKARINDFIDKLQEGYDTLIGERGTKLSLGQRQRISIARAFLMNTPILILDEPTASIDLETESYLKNSLDELMKGRTTIIISHRMSLTDITDNILVIGEGKITEKGTIKELDESRGFYHAMRVLERPSPGGNE